MKTIFTLFASLLLSISLFATDARPKSMLTVKSFGTGDIRVVLDGRRFEPGVNSVMIRDLESGFHQVKVYRQKSNGFFNLLGKRYEMVYSTSLMIKPATQVLLSIDRFGTASIDEKRIRGNFSDRDREWGYNKDSRDHDNNWDADRSYDFDHDGKLGDYDTNYGYESGMNDREFSQLLQDISKEWLESNKLKSATQIVTTNNLTSAQVKQMVLLFNFESNKLDLAKQAYRNTVDKKNYFMINDVFSFSSSKDDLARFIHNH